VDSRLKNKIFEGNFKLEKDALGHVWFEYFRKKEVQNATNA
jgi:hypothetical protein